MKLKCMMCDHVMIVSNIGSISCMNSCVLSLCAHYTIHWRDTPIIIIDCNLYRLLLILLITDAAATT